ncbi:hypothetical protein [Niveibacterium sp.]|uniref:hypothetical protein n=1 Tax=Niveibacterium sp. TaxID=2017444 RepID=UPI0035B41FC8
MTLPRLAALTRRWKSLPPAAVSIGRIAQWLGAVPKETAKGDPLQQIQQSGIPASDRLPEDPDLAFLDHDVPLGAPAPRA